MTYNLRDIALSVSLLVISAIWTWLVIDTIPTGWGHGDIGPRAFPMVLGIIMGSLAVLLLIPCPTICPSSYGLPRSRRCFRSLLQPCHQGCKDSATSGLHEPARRGIVRFNARALAAFAVAVLLFLVLPVVPG